MTAVARHADGGGMDGDGEDRATSRNRDRYNISPPTQVKRTGTAAARNAAADTSGPRTSPLAVTAKGAQASPPRDLEFPRSREPVETTGTQAGEIRGPEPGLPGSARATFPPAAGAAETARAVAAQLAEGVAQRGGNEVEITLSPEELGRVRLALSGAEGTMAVTVTAERPETLDLMRRHIDVLAQELRDMGFAKLSFSFGQGNAQSRSGGDLPTDQPAAAVATGESGSPAPARRPDGSGLDLRL